MKIRRTQQCEHRSLSTGTLATRLSQAEQDHNRMLGVELLLRFLQLEIEIFSMRHLQVARGSCTLKICFVLATFQHLPATKICSWINRSHWEMFSGVCTKNIPTVRNIRHKLNLSRETQVAWPRAWQDKDKMAAMIYTTTYSNILMWPTSCSSHSQLHGPAVFFW